MIQEKQYDPKGLEFLSTNGRPIPGESLTNSPDTPYPWEQATQFTELEPAIDALFIELTEPETDGFQKGMWNPDLLLLLVEPVMYMLMALGEKAGIMDAVIYSDEQEDYDDDDKQLNSIEKAIDIAQDKVVPKLKSGVMPQNIQEKIKEFTPPELPSLLAQQPQENNLSDNKEI